MLTLRAVFSAAGDLTPAEIFGALEQASPLWLGASLLCMTGFIVLEGLALLYLLRHLHCPRGFFRGLRYSAADQFFSAITPSATGGQPAAALVMRNHQVPGGVITAALLLNLVLYTAATLTIGVVCLIWKPGVFLTFGGFAKALIVFGMVALTGLTLLFWGLLKRGELLSRLGWQLFRFLHQLHLMRDPDRWSRRLGHMAEEYGTCARAMAGKPAVLVTVFLLNLAQRIAQITVPLTLHCAMGGSLGAEGAELWVVQALAQIGSNCVPIPGGMGAADYLMLDGFGHLFSDGYAYQLQILSRGVSFYVCTLVSGLIVLIGFLSGRFQALREKER